MDLQGKTIIVTGATSGLGLAFSQSLVKKGATVFGLARRKDRLHDLEERFGPSFHGIVCDVAVEDHVVGATGKVLSETGRIDVLINNAGLGRFGKLEHTPTEDWDIQMNTNLRGVFLCTRSVIPIMKEQNQRDRFGGHIINISSVAGLVGNAQVSVYNATKFGLRGFSEAIMKELRDDGIRVTCIFPGSVETEFFEEAGAEISANPMTSEDITSSVLHVLEAPDNYLISEITMRPLRPRG
jgi:NADP-dependent 3-hydroxy acid dehydrogenase YdfG